MKYKSFHSLQDGRRDGIVLKQDFKGLRPALQEDEAGSQRSCKECRWYESRTCQ